MNKLILSTLFVLLSYAAFAAPYFLIREHFQNTHPQTLKYAIEDIVNKEPIPYKIIKRTNQAEEILTESQSPVNLPKAYKDWFQNLSDLITAQNRWQEFGFMKETLDFVLSGKAFYMENTQEAPSPNTITVYIVPQTDPFWQKTRISSAGSYYPSTEDIQIYINEDAQNFMDLQYVLTHEIGHSLAISDSYPGAISLRDIEYGGEAKPSIMYSEQTLTCDDADALASALYLSMKKNNKITGNFTFKSFCGAQEGEEILFHNSQQLDRKPSVLLSRGYYYLLEFCSDGNIKKSTKIDYREPRNIFSPTVYRNCYGIDYDENETLSADQEKPAIKINLFSNNRVTISSNKNTVIHEYAPAIVREITFGDSFSETTVRIKNKDGIILYAYAILNDRQSFVYAPPENISFIYDVSEPSQFTALKITAKGAVTIGNQDSQTINKLIQLRNLFERENKKNYGIYVSGISLNDLIEQALRWQEYLQKYYPYEEEGPESAELKITNEDLSNFGEKINGLSKI